MTTNKSFIKSFLLLLVFTFVLSSSVLGLNIGFQSIGASTDTAIETAVSGPYTFSSGAAVITNLLWYGNTGASGNNVWGVLYNCSTDSPTTLLTNTSAYTNQDVEGWHNYTLNYSVSNFFWFFFIFDSGKVFHR
jgi:hypothetical protein